MARGARRLSTRAARSASTALPCSAASARTRVSAGVCSGRGSPPGGQHRRVGAAVGAPAPVPDQHEVEQLDRECFEPSQQAATRSADRPRRADGDRPGALRAGEPAAGGPGRRRAAGSSVPGPGGRSGRRGRPAAVQADQDQGLVRHEADQDGQRGSQLPGSGQADGRGRAGRAEADTGTTVLRRPPAEELPNQGLWTTGPRCGRRALPCPSLTATASRPWTPTPTCWRRAARHVTAALLGLPPTAAGAARPARSRSPSRGRCRTGSSCTGPPGPHGPAWSAAAPGPLRTLLRDGRRGEVGGRCWRRRAVRVYGCVRGWSSGGPASPARSGSRGSPRRSRCGDRRRGAGPPRPRRMGR